MFGCRATQSSQYRAAGDVEFTAKRSGPMSILLRNNVDPTSMLWVLEKQTKDIAFYRAPVGNGETEFFLLWFSDGKYAGEQVGQSISSSMVKDGHRDVSEAVRQYVNEFRGSNCILHIERRIPKQPFDIRLARGSVLEVSKALFRPSWTTPEGSPQAARLSAHGIQTFYTHVYRDSKIEPAESTGDSAISVSMAPINLIGLFADNKYIFTKFDVKADSPYNLYPYVGLTCQLGNIDLPEHVSEELKKIFGSHFSMR
jgi:hypothetical protein